MLDTTEFMQEIRIYSSHSYFFLVPREIYEIRPSDLVNFKGFNYHLIYMTPMRVKAVTWDYLTCIVYKFTYLD